jgi:nicotinate-nucleotide adenylyltransferase
MRIGIFGGSFDPVHNGHLAVARACQEQASLDEVWLVPTAVQPLKRKGPQATNAQRIEMLRLALEENPTWRVCTLEIDRGGASYTVDTLRQLHEELPDAELFFLMGSDALRDVARWKEPREIFRLATPLVVHRAGESAPNVEMLQAFCAVAKQPRIVEMPPLEISSTEIRRRLASAELIDEFVPPAVVRYIAQNSIYT